MSWSEVLTPAYVWAILLVGVGGTGSFVAHILAQLACWAKTANIDMRLYFIDPDIVEQRNLVRQNFCPTDAFVADNSEICFAQIGILINNVNETTSIGNWLKYS